MKALLIAVAVFLSSMSATVTADAATGITDGVADLIVERCKRTTRRRRC